MEDTWTELSLDVVRNALPTDLATLHASWVDANPAKANRLSEVVAEVLRTFRAAVEANPANIMDEDANTVPSAGFRHALNSVLFNIGMEMGVQFSPEVYAAMSRAEVWLRMVQNGGIPVNTMAGKGSPSYLVPHLHRWLR